MPSTILAAGLGPYPFEGAVSPAGGTKHKRDEIRCPTGIERLGGHQSGVDDRAQQGQGCQIGIS